MADTVVGRQTCWESDSFFDVFCVLVFLLIGEKYFSVSDFWGGF